jgi:hypothetical protein
MTEILPMIALPALAHARFAHSGMDTRIRCRDRAHFDAWHKPIDYCYNSRGFRDQEWPHDPGSATWCIGDSFTVGIGSAFDDTWPQKLSQHLNCRTINVSMDGASNDWIARQACAVYTELEPGVMVLMWSYLHRRELDRPGPDLQRRAHYVKSSIQQDYANLDRCRQQVQQHCVNSKLIELIIPNWQPALTPSSWANIKSESWPWQVHELDQASAEIWHELEHVHSIDVTALRQQLAYPTPDLIQVPQLDLARDGHHFDAVTSQWVAEQVGAQLTGF